MMTESSMNHATTWTGVAHGRSTSGLALLSLLPLVLCACAPSEAEIAGKVKVELAQRLAPEFAGDQTAVQIAGVVVVQEGSNKYRGQASVNAFGASLPLKVSLLADRKNLIVDTDAGEWRDLITAIHRQKLKVVENQSSDIAASNDVVFSSFPAVLKKHREAFAERLQVVRRVESRGVYWFGSGCMAHDCGSNEAAWAINRDTGKGVAVIMIARPGNAPEAGSAQAAALAAAVAESEAASEAAEAAIEAAGIAENQPGIRGNAAEPLTAQAPTAATSASAAANAARIAGVINREIGFEIYGSPIDGLPEPLEAWASEMGMTDFNSGEIRD
jgi:hypothetical protein